MRKRSIFGIWFLLLTPLLLFLILVIPYQYVNSEFIVEWLGCGCPRIDESGNMIESKFNANDFTACFWTLIALCAAALAVPISSLLPRKEKWLRVIYVLAILAVSLLIAQRFTQGMMWN